jgi:large subunit ribosomal protein L18
MKVQKRRRRENKTDYLKREKLLKSEKPRVVFRKTNKYLIAQYVVSEAAQDKVLFGITSKDLLKHGWPESAKGGLKNISASYLTGYLTGRKILSEKWDVPVVDLGMARILHKTRIFAFIKGLIDSGLEITSKESAFPEDSRLKGEHLKNKVDVEKIKSNLDNLKSTNKQ